MLSLLGSFIGELRAAGLPVSMTEHVDAARAIEVIDLNGACGVHVHAPLRSST